MKIKIWCKAFLNIYHIIPNIVKRCAIFLLFISAISCSDYLVAQFPVAEAVRKALMKPSRSPSMTALMLPFSKPVR